MLGELAAVRRQREFVESACIEVPREGAEQPDNVLANEWFAACDAQLADTARDEGRAKTIQFLE